METRTPAPPLAPERPELPGLDELLRRRHRENFPVASVLLPARARRHLLAVYAFARLADELGDRYEGDRLAALDELEHQLDLALAGEDAHPAVTPVADTVRELDLDPTPLRRLLDANRQDQIVTGYETFDDLVGYCRLSADPVGRLVLGVFDQRDPRLLGLSDRVCTGLQLVEHLQDVGEDARDGRIYLPSQDLRRFGVEQTDLLAVTAPPALRTLLRFEAARARWWLDAGTELLAHLSGWARLAVLGFVAGGRAALDALADADHDVLGRSTTPRRTALLSEGARLALGAVRP